MTSVAERIRARLQEVRHASRSANSNSSNDSDSNRNPSWSGLSLIGVGREQCVANLKLAVALNIYGRKFCYPNYMETGFAICDALITIEQGNKWFKEYCLEPYPDVCQCGQVHYGSSNCLREHCIICRGEVRKFRIDGYTVQRLASHIGCHYSWIEYAAAWALAGYRPSCIE